MRYNKDQKLKKAFIYIFLFSFWSNLYGQKRQLTLIIDTLELNNFVSFRPATKRTLIDEELLIPYQKYDSINRENQLFNFNSYPNYSSSFTLFDDSTELLIPFDNGGGYFSLLNLAKLPTDTIRISSWTIYLNCYNDTIFTTTNYWKVKYQGGLTEDLGILFKKKTKIKIVKKECTSKPPSTIKISINQTHYHLKLCLPQKLDGQTSIGCGYPNYKPSWDLNPPARKVLRHSRITEYFKTINVLFLRYKNGN